MTSLRPQWNWGVKKTDLARALVRDRGFPIATVARTLAVSRSNLHERPDETPAKRGPYVKLSDEELLSAIIQIVDERPTYGYRRIWALLNRGLQEKGLPVVNHKRVYRLMKAHNLLLTRTQPRHDTRAHTGKIETNASDTRWCGDGFEIGCSNGEKVRAIFVLDCHDREVISVVTSKSGYTADMAQTAILRAVEKRFNASQTDHEVEWLTDNGSCFVAKETLALSDEIGIINRFTPVRSPQSNGMAEAFVKTFKRDYVSCHATPDASQVIEQMEAWIEDYNENAPHKSLRWLSPRQFRKQEFFRLQEISPGAARAEKAA